METRNIATISIISILLVSATIPMALANGNNIDIRAKTSTGEWQTISQEDPFSTTTININRGENLVLLMYDSGTKELIAKGEATVYIEQESETEGIDWTTESYENPSWLDDEEEQAEYKDETQQILSTLSDGVPIPYEGGIRIPITSDFPEQRVLKITADGYENTTIGLKTSESSTSSGVSIIAETTPTVGEEVTFRAIDQGNLSNALDGTVKIVSNAKVIEAGQGGSVTWEVDRETFMVVYSEDGETIESINVSADTNSSGGIPITMIAGVGVILFALGIIVYKYGDRLDLGEQNDDDAWVE